MQQLLKARELETKAFLVACMEALAADPDAFLALLTPYWPAPAPRGRPWPKAEASDAETIG
ncbi:hypothetical protein [Nocardia sp. NPDC059239]|uniref:hypothetical protein n=1 Tax=Nocardia sp. NPDC059239 TaxID=3346785 RepID=UPI00368FCFDB